MIQSSVKTKPQMNMLTISLDNELTRKKETVTFNGLIENYEKESESGGTTKNKILLLNKKVGKNLKNKAKCIFYETNNNLC